MLVARAENAAVDVAAPPRFAVTARTLGVRRAAGAARGGGRIARVRRADERRPQPAATVAVARVHPDDRVALALARHTDGVDRPAATGPQPVAPTVPAAGRRRCRRTEGGRPRPSARRPRHADARRSHGVACRALAVHALSQQTPSAQKPLAQSPADAHAAPIGSVGRMLPRSKPPSAPRAARRPTPPLPSEVSPPALPPAPLRRRRSCPGRQDRARRDRHAPATVPIAKAANTHARIVPET